MKVYKPLEASAVRTREHTKPICLVDDLASLHGPKSGRVALPVHIDWSAASDYDLDNPVRVRTMYSTVLQEASTEEELASFIDAGILVREWRSLRLPGFVRETWERQHSSLR